MARCQHEDTPRAWSYGDGCKISRHRSPCDTRVNQCWWARFHQLGSRAGPQDGVARGQNVVTGVEDVVEIVVRPRQGLGLGKAQRMRWQICRSASCRTGRLRHFHAERPRPMALCAGLRWRLYCPVRADRSEQADQDAVRSLRALYRPTEHGPTGREGLTATSYVRFTSWVIAVSGKADDPDITLIPLHRALNTLNSGMLNCEPLFRRLGLLLLSREQELIVAGALRQHRTVRAGNRGQEKWWCLNCVFYT